MEVDAATCLPGEVLWTLPEDGGGGTTVRLGSGTTMAGGAVTGDAITGTVGCVRHSGYKRAYDFSVSFAVNGGATSAQLFTMR